MDTRRRKEGRPRALADCLMRRNRGGGAAVHVTFVICLRNQFRVFQMYQVILGDIECGKEGPLSSSIREIC